MQDPIESAVRRAIATMHDNLGDLLTIDDMAHAAMFSKFHFTRIFQRTTGVSPGRFLSAVRLQEAKQLLLSTSMTVVDISIQVGYNSVGTFSSRFTRSVGLSPTIYRQLRGFASQLPVDAIIGGDPDAASAVVRGRVWPSPGTRAGTVFVGLFPTRMPEGPPVRCTILDGPGPYTLEGVPVGRWYVLSHSVCATSLDEVVSRPFSSEQGLSVGAHGPIAVRRDMAVDSADVQLRPISPLDPPVLLALLRERKAAVDSAVSRQLAA